MILVSTPYNIIKEALEIGKISEKDIIADLGCGDGRVAIIAAKYYGSKGLCIEIDENLCALAMANVKYNKVEDKVEVICGDFFSYELRKATVVYVYQYSTLLKSLSIKLKKELKKGSKVITLDFPIEGWIAEKIHLSLDDNGIVRKIFFYIIGVSDRPEDVT